MVIYTHRGFDFHFQSPGETYTEGQSARSEGSVKIPKSSQLTLFGAIT